MSIKFLLKINYRNAYKLSIFISEFKYKYFLFFLYFIAKYYGINIIKI